MWNSRRARVAALTLAGTLAVAANAATLEIGLMLPGEKVASTLADAGERKTVGFAGIEGTRLGVSALASKGSHVRPVLSLLDPDGTPVDVGETNPKSGARARFRAVTLPTTGVWRIGVETPPGAGGAFVLTTTAKSPSSFHWTGVLAEGVATSDRDLPAAPGGALTVFVASKGRPAFDPTIDVVAPSGAVLQHLEGTKGRVTVRVPVLPELGRYVVRVGGGPGSFAAAARVVPAKKRTLAYRDVESRPDVRGFTPQDTPNDSVVVFALDGLAYSTQQTVSIVDGDSAKAAAPVRQVDAGGASSQIDLAGVAPGVYSLRVTTAAGNVTDAPGRLTVSNRVPGIVTLSPDEISNAKPFGIDLRGAGFDTTAVVLLRHASDGALVPVTIQSRTGHDKILATGSPPKFLTGPCDLEVRDPDGSRVVVAGGIDLLGFSAAPVSIRQSAAAGAGVSFHPRDSCYDDIADRVLYSIVEQKNSVFVLYDPATRAVADTLVMTPSDTGLPGSSAVAAPRVAWDRTTRTFILCVAAGGGNVGLVRVVSDSNLHDTKVQALVGGGSYGTEVSAAAIPTSGGFLAVWSQRDGGGAGSKIKAQFVTPQMTIDTSAQSVIATHSTINVWEPVIASQGDGRFVVAWAGTAGADVAYAVHATVVDATGVQVNGAGPYVTATSVNWASLFQPEIARNPLDGSMLLAFTYYDIDVYRPGVQRLAPVTADPGPYSALDSNSQLPQGYIDSVRWNPARSEFVAVMTNAENRVAVRRVNPDGTIRPTVLAESYEGTWGVLYAGPKAGQLGLCRQFDGTDDDFYYPVSAMSAVVGPIR